MWKVMVLCLFLSSCSGGSKFVADYELGAEKQVTVGSVMVTASSQIGVGDQVTKITEQLVYGGIAGRIIKISAREYGEDLTKQVASQELQYDLSESEVITYRDLTIQVMEASNKQIRFKVLTGPENPNAPKEEAPAEKEEPPLFPQ